jgi:hypothetical protein
MLGGPRNISGCVGEKQSFLVQWKSSTGPSVAQGVAWLVHGTGNPLCAAMKLIDDLENQHSTESHQQTE